MAKKITAGGAEPSVQNAVTLANVATDVRSWIDTIEGLEGSAEPEQMVAALQAQASTILAGKDKVEAFCQFVRKTEAEAAWFRSEADRHNTKATILQALADRLMEYAQQAMKDNELPELPGHSYRLKQDAKPDSVLITNEALVPSKYKRLTIQIKAEDWERLIDQLNESIEDGEPPSDPGLVQWLTTVAVSKTTCDVQKTPIKKAIDLGEEVPGADLSIGGSVLRIK